MLIKVDAAVRDSRCFHAVSLQRTRGCNKEDIIVIVSIGEVGGWPVPFGGRRR